MRRLFTWLSTIALLSVACNVNTGIDPLGLFQPIDEAIEDFEQSVEDALADPLSAKPFPVLIGGDNERVHYATNLGDVRINFTGPTNDVVIPGFHGPSNLYRFEDKKRELVQPLIAGGAFYGMSTDGRFIAYVSVDDVLGVESTLFVRDTLNRETRQIVRADADGGLWLAERPTVDEGRLAYAIHDANTQTWRLVIEDLNQVEPTIEIESDWIAGFDLRADRLAYASEVEDGRADIHLRNLTTGEDHIIGTGDAASVEDIFLALNTVVWSEWTADGQARVHAYDVPNDRLRTWADAVEGSLRGANDSFFVTEELIMENLPWHIVIRRYDAEGLAKKLAEFRADGLAGQLTVAGDRAAWVNPERQIVLMPLEGGDRLVFRPF